MNEDRAKEWIEALRYGGHHPITGMLSLRKYGVICHCAIGVAVNLFNPRLGGCSWEDGDGLDGDIKRILHYDRDGVPIWADAGKYIREYMGMQSSGFLYDYADPRSGDVVYDNDVLGSSHSAIATKIERHWRTM